MKGVLYKKYVEQEFQQGDVKVRPPKLSDFIHPGHFEKWILATPQKQVHAIVHNHDGTIEVLPYYLIKFVQPE